MELNSPQKSIIIISSGQPSLNPRLVKEADALANSGFQVTVLYAFWNNWGTQYDVDLLAAKKWKAIRLGGGPKQKPFIYFLSRLTHKISSLILLKTRNNKFFADISIARSSYFLIRGAKKYKADLYIAHNLGALPATVKASKKYGKPCGFDAEDFHRQEVSDDINSFPFKLCKFIEDKYLPSVNYITASSSLIAEKYASLYNRKVTTILNVFPKTVNLSVWDNKNKPLKLFWFSQTLGPNRGIESVIEAIGLSPYENQLHLLGFVSAAYKQRLLELCKNNRVSDETIFFYEPVKPGNIFGLANQFDIGIASETGFCLNNNMAVSNKIFTYIQSGLTVAASNTPAQSDLIMKYPAVGSIYRDAKELSLILNRYHENKGLLLNAKMEAMKIAQSELNWECESEKFMNIITKVLS